MAIFGKQENTAKTEGKKPAAAAGSFIPQALVQPRISEKAGKLSSQGKYVFNVLRSANKVEVKKAVEKAYKVNVVQVNMVNNKGKRRNFGRIAGKTSDFKKAIVTLKKGQTIEGATETI